MQVWGVRFGLGSHYIELSNLQGRAHERLKANYDDDAGWEALACIYSELPRLRAELILVSESRIGDRAARLNADGETRCEMADRILLAGGVPTFDGKRVEVGRGTTALLQAQPAR